MTLSQKINKEVKDKTGFDVPQLSGRENVKREKIISALKWSKKWHEDFAHDCQNQIDIIMKNNFTVDEIEGA